MQIHQIFEFRLFCVKLLQYYYKYTMNYNSEIHIFGSFQHKTTNFTNNLITKRLSEYIDVEGNYEKLLQFNNNSNSIIVFVENTVNEMSINKMEDSIILNHCTKDDPNIVIDHLLYLIEGSVVNVQQINNVFNMQNDDSLINNLILKTLLPYQIPHVLQLHGTMLQQDCILDASDTGTGKTYMALALAKLAGLRPFIISPKSVLYTWHTVAQKMGIELIGISNYESLKSGKYFKSDNNNVLDESKKIKCEYVTITGMIDDDDDNLSKKDKAVKGNRNFEFSFPSDTLIIFDEAHRCKNFRSITSKMLIAMKNNNTNKNKILLLSATITDKILCFKPFGVVFGFYDDVIQFKNWAKQRIAALGPMPTAGQREKINSIKAKSVTFVSEKISFEDEILLKVINAAVFPQYGSRIRIKELGELFPQNQITAQLYYCNNTDEINQQYDIIKVAFEEYKMKQTSSGFPLAIILYARMKIELFKIPIILDVANDALENGYSVVIFVCFKETLNQLAEHLNTSCLIYGKQTLEERNIQIERFQDNKTDVLISMLSAGSCGISLHDIHGGHPRMSIINAGWNGIELKQALGRIHRAGAQTPALQRLVFCANTYEDNICKAIEQKIKNIDSINDGEYDDGDIEKELMQQQANDEIKFTKITEEEAKKIQKEDTTLKSVKKGKNKAAQHDN